MLAPGLRGGREFAGTLDGVRGQLPHLKQCVLLGDDTPLGGCAMGARRAPCCGALRWGCQWCGRRLGLARLARSLTPLAHRPGYMSWAALAAGGDDASLEAALAERECNLIEAHVSEVS